MPNENSLNELINLFQQIQSNVEITIDDTIKNSTNPVQNAAIQIALNNKADTSTITSLQSSLNNKADLSSINSLQSSLNNKAPASPDIILYAEMPTSNIYRHILFKSPSAWGTFQNQIKSKQPAFDDAGRFCCVIFDYNDGGSSDITFRLIPLYEIQPNNIIFIDPKYKRLVTYRISAQTFTYSDWLGSGMVVQDNITANGSYAVTSKAIYTALQYKANTSTVTSLQSTINNKADASTVTTLQNTVNAAITPVVGSFTPASGVRIVTGDFQNNSIRQIGQIVYIDLSLEIEPQATQNILTSLGQLNGVETSSSITQSSLCFTDTLGPTEIYISTTGKISLAGYNTQTTRLHIHTWYQVVSE